jgi:hypothetical protein
VRRHQSLYRLTSPPGLAVVVVVVVVVVVLHDPTPSQQEEREGNVRKTLKCKLLSQHLRLHSSILIPRCVFVY